MNEAPSMLRTLGIDVDHDYAVPADVWRRVTAAVATATAKETP